VVVLEDGLAYRIAALPTEYGDTRIRQLFSRGYDAWEQGEEADADALLTDVEAFGRAALREETRHEISLDPPVDDPGGLAVVATLAATVVEQYDRFEDTSRQRLQPYVDVRELYTGCLMTLMARAGDREIQQDVAEVVYGKPHGSEPYPGRVCTGIVEKPAFDGGLYVEIPMPAASRKCLVYDDDGDLDTRIEDNHLYVPATDLDERYQECAARGFDRLVNVQQDGLNDAQISWLESSESAITDLLARFDRHGQYEHLWTGWEPGNKLIHAVQNAVDAAPDDVVQLGTYHDSSTLYTVLEEHDPENEWEEAIHRRVTSPSSLGAKLSEHADHSELEIDTDAHPSQYKFATTTQGSTALPVDEIEDLFELPCMANMEQRLHEEGPTRKDLYSFVRLVRWLPQYRDAPLETIISDLKDVFERWPWYDEQETDYQLRYELQRSNTPDGDPDREWLPRSCDNDDMQHYCIGKENCPYSIYGSLPFPDELYDQLDLMDEPPSV